MPGLGGDVPQGAAVVPQRQSRLVGARGPVYDSIRESKITVFSTAFTGNEGFQTMFSLLGVLGIALILFVVVAATAGIVLGK